ncbi:MAG: hypothetical protein ABEJ86_07730 [Halococcoides sp.]
MQNEPHDARETPLLTETGSGGFFTRGYVGDDPVVTYLDDDEVPLFVLSNGRRGVTRDTDDETTTITPARGYSTVVVVTDRRILFVVGGGEDGDWVESVWLSDLEYTRTDQSLFRQTVTIETKDGTRWRFHPTDADLDALVSYLDEAAWRWSRAQDQLEAARSALVDASQSQFSGDFEEALASIDDVEQSLETAHEIADAFGPARGQGLANRVEEVEQRCRETTGRVSAARGSHLVEEAERTWQDGNFEEAYDAYTDAKAAFRRAIDVWNDDAEKVEYLETLIGRIDENLDALSTAPIDGAQTLYKRATEASDPETAIVRWERTLERYQTLLELDWGRDEKRFAVDHDRARERLETIVDELLSAYDRAATDAVEEAEAAVDVGAHVRAHDRYDAARNYLESAIEKGREFAPDRIEGFDERVEEIERRLSEIDDQISIAATSEGTVGDREAFEPAVKADITPVEEEGADSVSASEESPESTAASAVDRDDCLDRIADLDADTFTQVVATIWEGLGWTVEDDTHRPFDLIVEKRRPLPERLGIVVSLDRPERDRIVDLADLPGPETSVDIVAIATAAPVEAPIVAVANERGVKLLDGSWLCERAVEVSGDDLSEELSP